MRDVVIVDSVRTGMTKAMRGKLHKTRPDDMAAHCISALMKRNPKVEPDMIEDSIIGCASPEGAQGVNIGRTAAILAGLPITTSGLTINRFCSSGLQSIALAAQSVGSGGTEVAVAGGVESISMSGGANSNNVINPIILEKAPAIYMAMGQTAENVAQRYKVSRETQDEYSLSSQQRTARAQEEGLFDDEIIPLDVEYDVKDKESGEITTHKGVVKSDECNRPSTDLAGLAKLKPSFDENGSVGPGNSSQLTDGASMTLVMSAERAGQLGLEPLAYFRGFTTVGCEPDEMGIGPIYSIPKLLKILDLKMGDIDLVELNEAFASQVCYIRDHLGIDPATLNVNGGAISIGHPFGMTGSRCTGHVTRELKRQKKKYGMVTMCVGGGMGATGIFEAC